MNVAQQAAACSDPSVESLDDRLDEGDSEAPESGPVSTFGRLAAESTPALDAPEAPSPFKTSAPPAFEASAPAPLESTARTVSGIAPAASRALVTDTPPAPAVSASGPPLVADTATDDFDAPFFLEIHSDVPAFGAFDDFEIPDPRYEQRMSEGAARRRAHLAKYVVGVVAVSAALCVAALAKSALPVSDDSSKETVPSSVR